MAHTYVAIYATGFPRRARRGAKTAIIVILSSYAPTAARSRGGNVGDASLVSYLFTGMYESQKLQNFRGH